MTGLVLLLLIWAYDRSTPATCLYTAIHGSYGSVIKKYIANVVFIFGDLGRLSSEQQYSRKRKVYT
jgi:hypothetical protein